MSNVQVCDFAEGLVDEVKKFRFSKAKCSRAIIMKIDIQKQLVSSIYIYLLCLTNILRLILVNSSCLFLKLVIEDTLEDVTAEILQSELPERQPRFILYSFELDHGDGRISYPMCLIWSTPIGCKTDLQMMYAGTKLPLVKEAGITKVFEIRELDELSDEWLESRMKG